MKNFLLMLGMLLPLIILNALKLSSEEIQDEFETKRKIAAVLQTTVKQRFSKNLQLGDEVVYKRKQFNQDEETEFVSLKVTKKENGKMVILEEFDNNKVFIEIKLEDMSLTKIWGTDMDNNPKAINLIPIEEAKRLTKVQNNTRNTINYKTIKKTLNIAKNNLSCTKVIADFGKRNTIAQNFAEQASQYYSKQVPKMLPLLDATIQNMNDESLNNTLNRLQSGLVKNANIELKKFNRFEANK